MKKEGRGWAELKTLLTAMGSFHAGSVADQEPWFAEYKKEFHRMLSFGDLETFDHPVACTLHTTSPPLPSCELSKLRR